MVAFRLLAWLTLVAALGLARSLFLSPFFEVNRSLAICSIQGSGFSSPWQGTWATTTGIVFADLDSTAGRGFYIQQEACDARSTTSDGIFVYLAERMDIVMAGDLVQVSGTVQESYGRTQILAASPQIQVLARGRPLPTPIELAPPFDPLEARVYFEHLEGMSVQAGAATVVGPTDGHGQTWIVNAASGVARVFYDDPLGVGERIALGDAGLFKVTPPARAGDALSGISGALDYQLGTYLVQLISLPVLTPGLALPPASIAGQPDLSAATFNLAGLFDTLDDPNTDDSVLSASEYRRRLYKRALAIHTALGEPDILAVQEAENRAVLQALAADPDVIRADYQVVTYDGPDRRGLDVALLYRTDRVWSGEAGVRQGCTALVDGLGPDGNEDPLQPVNALTCDANGDGLLDGNRLFSRPPLVVRLQRVVPSAGVEQKGAESPDFWVIVCHLKSKVEDTALTTYTLPRRIEQARFLAGLVRDLQLTHPGSPVLVMGDFNDHIESLPLSELTRLGLVDVSGWVPRSTRYTYLHQGVSQSLDYIFWMPSIALFPGEVAPVHINADYPEAEAGNDVSMHRSSDHDPLRASFYFAAHRVWLPLAAR